MKVALLTCIAFTTGVCWLVSQVSRQAGAPAPNSPTPTTLMSTTTVPPTDQLQRPSVSATSRTEPEAAPAVTVQLDPAPISAGAESVALPPIVHSDAVAAKPGIAEPLEAAPISDLPETARGPEPTEQPPAPAPGEPTAYKVAKGDSLSRIIARTYGQDSSQVRTAILALNPKLAKRPNRIFEGEELQLPPQTVVAGGAPAPKSAPPRSPSDGPKVAVSLSRGGLDAAKIDSNVGAKKTPSAPASRTPDAVRGEARRAAPTSPSAAKTGKTEPTKPAVKPQNVAKRKEIPGAPTGVKKPATKTVAKTVSGAAKPGTTRGAATAVKGAKPASAGGKPKDSKMPPAVAKDAKRSSAKPAREPEPKPVTRRRGGTIAAG